MATISSAARIAQDVGLAATLGGTLFGRAALQPALHEIADPQEADRVSARAWRRYGWINLAAHGLFAATWLVSRSLTRDKRIRPRVRALVRANDVLVGASLVTGLASVLLGMRLGTRGRHGIGPAQAHLGEVVGIDDRELRRTRTIRRAVGALGIANLAAAAGVLGVSNVIASRSHLLAMPRRGLLRGC
jgi:hypothetical protein